MPCGQSSWASWIHSGGTAVRPVTRSRSIVLSTSRGSSQLSSTTRAPAWKAVVSCDRPASKDSGSAASRVSPAWLPR